MFRILFWVLIGAALAFWVFKNDPELTFLLKFRDWLLSLFDGFKSEDKGGAAFKAAIGLLDSLVD